MATSSGLFADTLNPVSGSTGLTPLSRVDNLEDWLLALAQPAALLELAALVACAGVAWTLIYLFRRRANLKDESSIWFGRKIVDGVMFPLLMLCLGLVARVLLAPVLPITVFRVVIPVLVALAVIRLGVKVLQAAFKEAPLVRALERSISWLVWLAMVLWVSGLMPLILEELEGISWRVGATTLSLRTIIEGSLSAGGVLILTLWISAAIEGRLLRAATGSDLSLRKAISNATRALLVFVGLLVALSAVGIDLTALSVIGGAVGVGVGFGFQKLAASYVSGFVMLAERSVRIGDTVRVDGFEGNITDINARYTVVRALSGKESIVPNEMFINNRIENLSLADTRVKVPILVTVAYNSDIDLVITLLTEAALSQARVLKDFAPEVLLSQFGADGLEFRLNFWIDDPDKGQATVQSAVSFAILRAFREHHIEIPFPQRVLHYANAPAPLPELPARAG